jgi:hypothetical protein
MCAGSGDFGVALAWAVLSVSIESSQESSACVSLFCITTAPKCPVFVGRQQPLVGKLPLVGPDRPFVGAVANGVQAA